MDNSISACVQRMENAIGIVGLRLRPGAPNLMPQVSSVDLMKMVLLDGATLLAHFADEETS